MKRGISVLLLSLLLATLLSGCLFRGAESLYVLPRLSQDYTNLQDEIELLLAQGLEYAAPKSGENTQAIQFRDLDGDGQDEALAFFRENTSGDSTALWIYIYRKDSQELYQAVAQLKGEGSAFHSVEYVELDNDGSLELVVNYQISDQVYALNVYSLAEFSPRLLMQAGCSGYAVTNLDGDSSCELLLLQLDSSGDSGNRAEWYTLSQDGLSLSATVSLSRDLLSLQRIRSSLLAGGETAVYITASCDNGEQLVTDIIALQQDSLCNLTLQQDSGQSTLTLQEDPGDSIFATDINGDGIYEIPLATQLGSSGVWQVQWLQFSVDGSYQQLCTTLHAPDQGDGWYLELPDSFWERFSGRLWAVCTENSGYQESCITLYDLANTTDDSAYGTPLLYLYTITGSNRVSRGQLTGRYTLYTGSDTVYAYGLETASGLTQAQISSGFHFVPTTWSD